VPLQLRHQLSRQHYNIVFKVQFTRLKKNQTQTGLQNGRQEESSIASMTVKHRSRRYVREATSLQLVRFSSVRSRSMKTALRRGAGLPASAGAVCHCWQDATLTVCRHWQQCSTCQKSTGGSFRPEKAKPEARRAESRLWRAQRAHLPTR